MRLRLLVQALLRLVLRVAVDDVSVVHVLPRLRRTLVLVPSSRTRRRCLLIYTSREASRLHYWPFANRKSTLYNNLENLK